MVYRSVVSSPSAIPNSTFSPLRGVLHPIYDFAAKANTEEGIDARQPERLAHPLKKVGSSKLRRKFPARPRARTLQAREGDQDSLFGGDKVFEVSNELVSIELEPQLKIEMYRRRCTEIQSLLDKEKSSQTSKACPLGLASRSVCDVELHPATSARPSK